MPSKSYLHRRAVFTTAATRLPSLHHSPPAQPSPQLALRLPSATLLRWLTTSLAQPRRIGSFVAAPRDLGRWCLFSTLGVATTATARARSPPTASTRAGFPPPPVLDPDLPPPPELVPTSQPSPLLGPPPRRQNFFGPGTSAPSVEGVSYPVMSERATWRRAGGWSGCARVRARTGRAQ
jgi:hypothetical protein